MSPKRPPSNERPAQDAWQITDEWGIYDPAKAGMQALYARLGKPVLRDSTPARKHRRRAARPERSAEGVGEALNEARRRAGLLPPSGEFEAIPQSPARAMRAALQARAAEPQPAPHVPAPAEHEPAPARTEPKPAARKRVARKAPAAERPGRTAPSAPVPEAHKVRARPAARARAKAAAAPKAAASEAPRHQPPAPAPGRPRGPVPLAAWARSVIETPSIPAPAADKRCFWRRVFLIPSEVALVEYARGCRIHRLLIEAADEPVLDFI
ncbi:MAG: hypothetical protein AB7O28_05445 [Vicinamibacterales bacterium]